MIETGQRGGGRAGGGPIRRCASCRAQRARGGMLRVVRRADGSVELSRGGHADGRSAYVCRAKECIERAAAGPPLARALRTPVPAAVLAELKAEEAA